MVIFKIKKRNKGSNETNIRFLKNYVITFDEKYLTLYDLKGNILHTYYSFFIIENIFTINTKSLLLITKSKIISLIIEKENVKIKEIKGITSNGEFIDICLTSNLLYFFELDSLTGSNSKIKKEEFNILLILIEKRFKKLLYDIDNIIDSFYSKTNNLLFVSNGEWDFWTFTNQPPKIIIIKIDPINLLIFLLF